MADEKPREGGVLGAAGEVIGRTIAGVEDQIEKLPARREAASKGMHRLADSAKVMLAKTSTVVKADLAVVKAAVKRGRAAGNQAAEARRQAAAESEKARAAAEKARAKVAREKAKTKAKKAVKTKGTSRAGRRQRRQR